MTFAVVLLLMYGMLLTFKRAPANLRAEDIRTLPIIVAEMEFGNIEGKINFVHLVESSDRAALDPGPEALNRVCVDRPDYVRAAGVVDHGMRVFPVELAVANPMVRNEQTDLIRYGFANKNLQGTGVTLEAN